eukprot:797045-Amphidinium_carterae.3
MRVYAASAVRWCSWTITTSGSCRSAVQASSWRCIVVHAVQLTETTSQDSLRVGAASGALLPPP